MQEKIKILELAIIEITKNLKISEEELAIAKEHFEEQKKFSLLSEKTISKKREYLAKKEVVDYWKNLLDITNSWINELEDN